jgi:hypothetical protein
LDDRSLVLAQKMLANPIDGALKVASDGDQEEDE